PGVNRRICTADEGPQGRGEMRERIVMKTAARAVVIDPDPLWQQAVTAALTRSDVSVVANSGELCRALELAEAHGADLLLVGVDDDVDNRDLYRLLRRVHKRCPDLVTVVFVEH